jgi:hypothetical protein
MDTIRVSLTSNARAFVQCYPLIKHNKQTWRIITSKSSVSHEQFYRVHSLMFSTWTALDKDRCLRVLTDSTILRIIAACHVGLSGSWHSAVCRDVIINGTTNINRGKFFEFFLHDRLTRIYSTYPAPVAISITYFHARLHA